MLPNKASLGTAPATSGQFARPPESLSEKASRASQEALPLAAFWGQKNPAERPAFRRLDVPRPRAQVALAPTILVRKPIPTYAPPLGPFKNQRAPSEGCPGAEPRLWKGRGKAGKTSEREFQLFLGLIPLRRP